MAEFIERLKQAARLGGTGDAQADIARDLGVKRQTVNRWFVLGGEPDVNLTFHIASRYGVDPKWLKTGQGNMVPDPSQDGLASDEREVVRNYRSAPRPIREVIRTMLRAARKVAVVVVAAMIPPLLTPQRAEAAILHNHFFAHGANLIHIVQQWLNRLVRSLTFSSRNIGRA